ncbi:hypothetical protein ACFE04_009269 [Oxalis oulophora]
MYEMHFAVPMAGAVLNNINTRITANNIATILSHSEAKALFVDCEYVSLACEALQIMMAASSSLPRVNYTSGTTSDPKGVVYNHRGAYLNTLSSLLEWEMGTEPVYLWSLPMFHGNGWTFPWGICARGGTNVCIRNTTASEIYRNIAEHGVTQMCCVPVVFNIILDAKPHERREITSSVNILAGGAPPPASLLQKIEEIGFKVTHAYGLTECGGPTLVCEWKAEWNSLSLDKQAELKARQGITALSVADVDVKDMTNMSSVPRDGKRMGEIVLRGSGIMKGYYKNLEATSKAFKNGWLATGDVGVIHPDGYLEIKDRSKDIIISGGENVSSVEVESVLFKYPNISDAAVVAMPHPWWGESPCAFVVLRKDLNCLEVKEEHIIAYCRENLPHFMVPKRVEILDELPKIGNNKTLKGKLRNLAKNFMTSEE